MQKERALQNGYEQSLGSKKCFLCESKEGRVHEIKVEKMATCDLQLFFLHVICLAGLQCFEILQCWRYSKCSRIRIVRTGMYQCVSVSIKSISKPCPLSTCTKDIPKCCSPKLRFDSNMMLAHKKIISSSNTKSDFCHIICEIIWNRVKRRH